MTKYATAQIGTPSGEKSIFGLQSENAELREYIAELRERITQLEHKMFALAPLERAERIRRAFKLTPSQTKIVSALLARQFISRGDLMDVLYGAKPVCDQPDIKIIDVMICKLRAKLRAVDPSIAVQAVWGQGHAMSPEAKAKIIAIADVHLPLADLSI